MGVAAVYTARAQLRHLHDGPLQGPRRAAAPPDGSTAVSASDVGFDGEARTGMKLCVEDFLDLELPHDSSAPAIARRVLAQWGVNADADVAVSELVTNAVQHGKPPIRLHALRTWDFVHIEVHDEGPAFGEPKIDSVGLRLVEAFMTNWGIAQIPNDGKVVWAEFEP